MRIGTAGGIDAYIVGIAVHIAARDDEGGVVGTHLLGLPRQAYGACVRTLRGRETLHRGAAEQSGGDGFAVEVGIVERQAHLILIAGIGWQLAVGERQLLTC